MIDYNVIAPDIELLGASVESLNWSSEVNSLPFEGVYAFGMDITEPEIYHEEDETIGTIKLLVKVTVSVENKEVIVLNSVGRAGFKLLSKDNNKEGFKTRVAINGAATLLSLMRGKIEAATAAFLDDGKITIPMVNVIQFYKEKSSGVD